MKTHTATPITDTVTRLPRWVQEEIAHPAQEGGRNEQMIRIAPLLIRDGYNADQLHSLFNKMYLGGISYREIESVLRSAEKYARRPLQPRTIDAEQQGRLAGLTCQAKRDLPLILTKYSWPLLQIAQEIAERPGIEQTSTFLRELFDPDDVIWIGMKWFSGKPQHQSNFRTAREWLACRGYPGEFCSHCTFNPGTYSRCNEAVAARRYLVGRVGYSFQRRNWLGIPMVGMLGTAAARRRGFGQPFHSWLVHISGGSIR